MKDALGDRMKEYEKRSKTQLPRRSYCLMRLDGKNFSKYCAKLKKPFDAGFAEDMNETAAFLCKEIQGAKFAFVQSDEISILITDFDDIKSEGWFDYDVQKMTSISASLASNKFNEMRLKRSLSTLENFRFGAFDCRVWSVSDPFEVANTFLWRQKDCTRNSITMATLSVYSDKEQKGKNSDEKQEMLFQKGINWNDYPVRFKRGGFIVKQSYGKDGAMRSKWICIEPPIFTQDQNFLYSKIPVITSEGVRPITEAYSVASDTAIEKAVDGFAGDLGKMLDMFTGLSPA